MNEVIQIKCPFDGAVLSVRYMPGIEKKTVQCPICQHTYLFTDFKKVDKAGTSPDTGRLHQRGEEENTSYYNGGNLESSGSNGASNYIIGRLRIKGGERMFQLRPGKNVIGRKGVKSHADFQIDTEDNKRMSREHLVIEVKKIPAKGFVHYVSLCKEKVNKTYVGNEQLLYGDCIVLRDGDIIRLPGTELRFEIPDEDATVY